ncbi:UNVERIFIED_CONTAM: hypothetical protein Sindi_0074800, partial [Sesamum indicum]
MFSGTPRIPRGQGRGHGHGLPLLPVCRMVFKLGKQFYDHPTPPDTTAPSPAPQTPDDAGASRASLASNEMIH